MRELDKYDHSSCILCKHLHEVHELHGYDQIRCLICQCGKVANEKEVKIVY